MNECCVHGCKTPAVCHLAATKDVTINFCLAHAAEWERSPAGRIARSAAARGERPAALATFERWLNAA